MGMDNKCLRGYMDSLQTEFDKNTTTKKTKYSFEVKCNKGLFSVLAPQLEQAQKEAFYYFRQYLEDGEYET
jgi:hypothetical protein